MGPDRSHELHEQIRRESAALRAWATAVRAASAAARRRSQTARRAASRPGGLGTPVDTGSADARAGREIGRTAGGTDAWDTPQPVPVSDLFLILVEHHGLGVREAVVALAREMRRLGCPDDAEAIPAADAIDLIQAIVRPEQ
jgi:hypothetical protein